MTKHMKSHAKPLIPPAQDESARKRILRNLVADASSFKISERGYLDVATQLWSDLDTPRSLACALLLKYGEYAQLVDLECLPPNYTYDGEILIGGKTGGQRFADDYAATSLLKKWPNFVHPDLDPELACKKADEAAEQSCRLSNRRLRRALETPSQENSVYLHLISKMQTDIKRVLGGFCPHRWQEACRFGPGKAQGQQGSSDYEKLVVNPSCTAQFLLVGVALLAESTPWLEAVSNTGSDPSTPNGAGEEEICYKFDVVIEPGDRNIMVQKNAKTKRGIRPQPGLNVFAQLGLGQMMREQLLAAGLDLNDQVPNQRLAKLGATEGRIVTIDLKGASGHICKVLPQILLEDECPRWFYAMELTRTTSMLPHGCEDVDENWVPLQSYSAMGNGFTFELETLIFWAAVRACRQMVKDTQRYRVYGDDIICSRETAQVLIPFLAFLGFPLNTSKTFTEGPFRESCGADFWYGTNVRPVHFSIETEEINEANTNGISILRWLQTCNAIRRQARIRNHGFGCDRTLLPAWRTAVLRVPRNLRDSLKGPWSEIRDDFLITSDDDARSNPLVRRCCSLHSLTGPTLSVRVGEKPPKYYLAAKATLLYRRRGGDRVALQYDRSRSWLRRILQDKAEIPPAVRVLEERAFGDVLGDSSPTIIQANLWDLSLGAGWEIFQPVGDFTEWC